MPQIKALAFLLFAAALAMIVSRKVLSEKSFGNVSDVFYQTWVDIFIVSIISFISSNLTLFYVLLSAFILFRGWISDASVPRMISLFLVVSYCTPKLQIIAGLGEAGNLLLLTPSRLAAILILLPILVKGRPTVVNVSRSPNSVATLRPSRIKALDFLILLYPVWNLFIYSDRYAATHLARIGLQFIFDGILVYYVFSRHCGNVDAVRRIARAALVIMAFLAGVAVFESLKRYPLYTELQDVYKAQWSITRVLVRGNILRAQVTAETPITLGLWMIQGFAFSLLALSPTRSARPWICWGALFLACFLSGSRGPLLCLGIAALFAAAGFRYSGQVYGRLVAILVAATTIVYAFGLLDELQQTVSNLIVSFTKSHDTGSIDYRSRLYRVAVDLIKQSPLFGVPNYAFHMQELVQGEGIIDIVNFYIYLALDIGVIGLVMFMSPFLLVQKWAAEHLVFGKAEERAIIVGASAGLVGLMLTLTNISVGGTMMYAMLCGFAGFIAALKNQQTDLDQTKAAGGSLGGVLHDFPHQRKASRA